MRIVFAAWVPVWIWLIWRFIESVICENSKWLLLSSIYRCRWRKTEDRIDSSLMTSRWPFNRQIAQIVLEWFTKPYHHPTKFRCTHIVCVFVCPRVLCMWLSHLYGECQVANTTNSSQFNGWATHTANISVYIFVMITCISINKWTRRSHSIQYVCKILHRIQEIR